MDISQDMQSLLEKLDALELTDGERTAFGQLLGAEEESEVEGFGVVVGNNFEEYKVTVQGFSFGALMEEEGLYSRRRQQR